MTATTASSWAESLAGVELGTLGPPSLPGTEQASVADILAGAGIEDFLDQCHRADATLTLVINDGHRHTDTRGFLDALFGMPTELPELRLLVAAGTHKAGQAERSGHLETQAGPWLDRFGAVAWHDAYDDSALVAVGESAYHPWMAEGGHYLACGSMEPHYFAGVTGAHKTLTIGVMSRAGIEANHSGAMSAAAGPMRLEGNPVHEGVAGSLAALEAAGARMFALNQVIVGTTMVACSAGPPLSALAGGMAAVRQYHVRAVDRPVELVVARVGPPLDRDLYQADKGIKNTEVAVSDGGVLLLEARCDNGVGLDHFLGLLRQARDYAGALAVIERRGYQLGDHKALRLRSLGDLRGVRIGIVSPGLGAGLGEQIGIPVFGARREAADWAKPLLGPGARGLLIEDAGNVCIELEGAADRR